MNKQNREDFSPNNDKQTQEKKKNYVRATNRTKFNKPNKFSFPTATVMLLTLCVNIISPAKLAFSKSVIPDSLLKHSEELFILAQEEREEKSEKEEEREREEKSEKEEEREREEKSERRKRSRRESSEREEELSFEEEKESLEEDIDEHYEEWEENKKKAQISHSFSAMTTIVLTIVITLIGTGLFVIPSGRLIILGLGFITVLIQLNSNIFLLEKNLAGYEILEEQGLIIKEKLEYVETEEELSELKNLFRELVLESLSLE